MFAESLGPGSIEKLFHACQTRLSQVIPLMVAKPSSSGRNPRRWPSASRVIHSGATQQGGGTRGPQDAAAREEDAAAAADSALFEALWKYTQDRDSLAILVEVRSSAMHTPRRSRLGNPCAYVQVLVCQFLIRTSLVLNLPSVEKEHQIDVVPEVRRCFSVYCSPW